MKIFLDTANVEQIKKGARLGVIDGVTTNPTLLAKEGVSDYETVVKKICNIIDGPVSAEVVVEGKEEMLKQARQIAKWAPNVVVKIPSTATGMEVTSQLAEENI
ncbi:MAG: fructose-6-phosphate aldolase, partial [Chloroflexi bacterium]|nr:fructose-6-phosphate aldolase [Chloroflexota bacterium]